MTLENYDSSWKQKLFHNCPQLIKNAITTTVSLRKDKIVCGEYYKNKIEELQNLIGVSNINLNELQLSRLKSFLIFAKSQSTYYDKLFSKCGFNPDTLQDVSDLDVLPILTKQTLRDNLNTITPKNINQLDHHITHTSGTTGLGLRFAETSKSLQEHFAYRVFHIQSTGVRLREKWAYCAGHPVTNPNSNKPPYWVYDYNRKWLLLSSYNLSNKSIEHYLSKLNDFEPKLIAGYPSSVYLLAKANLEFKTKIRPTAVLTSSESLFDNQRIVIEKSFGCKAYSYYGNAERAGIAMECIKGKYHTRNDHSYIEILDKEDNPVQPGESGRLVCTGFSNYATPLIRYEVGDIVKLSRNQVCECGEPGKILDEILGRTEDYIQTPDGRLIGRLDHLFKDSTKVRMAQIIQNDIDSLTIRISPEENYSQDDEKAIRSLAHQRLGDSMLLKFEYHDNIPRTKGGKHKFVISNLTIK